jgi:predicted RNA-binding Zn-ribbon protein involved in translation (DUF1610 family)
MTKQEKIHFLCDTSGSEIKIEANLLIRRYLEIKCPPCGEAFLFSKTILRF